MQEGPTRIKPDSKELLKKLIGPVIVLIIIIIILSVYVFLNSFKEPSPVDYGNSTTTITSTINTEETGAVKFNFEFFIIFLSFGMILLLKKTQQKW